MSTYNSPAQNILESPFLSRGIDGVKLLIFVLRGSFGSLSTIQSRLDTGSRPDGIEFIPNWRRRG